MAEEQYLGISGWASWFDIEDNDGHRVRREAFHQTLIDRPYVSMLYNHDGNKVIGRWTKLEVKPTGLWVEGRIHDEDVAALVERDFLLGLSIGYRRQSSTKHDDGTVDIHQLTLLEVSITPTPSNPRCLITNNKFSFDDQKVPF